MSLSGGVSVGVSITLPVRKLRWEKVKSGDAYPDAMTSSSLVELGTCRRVFQLNPRPVHMPFVLLKMCELKPTLTF